MSNRARIYWYCQLAGWSFYIVVNSIFFGLSARSSAREYAIYFLMLPAGILLSHLYRLVIRRLRLIDRSIPQQMLAITAFSILNGSVFFLVILALSAAFGLPVSELTVVDLLESVINFSVIFCLWSFIYFGFKYFQNYKASEISALRYLAASRESELTNLRSQLNPHFIFNCLNSIRALVDESPPNAKTAVTRLSNILRYTLKVDQEREIALRSELDFVRDFLDLEKIRYEERLRFSFAVDPLALDVLIPPFIIQSQVENAVKHGIARLPAGGEVNVEARVENDALRITVSNTGERRPDAPHGVGFRNSQQRLQLLYGSGGRIQMRDERQFVIVEITIPLKSDAIRKEQKI